MKNKFRSGIVILITAIYCFAAIQVVSSPFLPEIHSQKSSDQEKHFKNISTNLFSHTSPSESSVNSSSQIIVPVPDKTISGFRYVCSAAEDVLKAAFAQYNNFSENLLIQHRKSDIIFPFHYFW